MSNIDKIANLYKNTGYFDYYSESTVTFIIISIGVFCIISYCYILANTQNIASNWSTQRCNASIIPFAGLINAPAGTSAFDYTSQNFNYCMQNIFSSMLGSIMAPITQILYAANNETQEVSNNINSIRNVVSNVRTNIQAFISEVMGRILNVTIPLQTIIISAKDFFGKMQGVMVATVYTLSGSVMTLNSLMGAIGQFMVTILIIMAAIIAGLWAVPVTWGVAATGTVMFAALAIPIALILVFMKDVLKINTTGLHIPSIKCFDKNTEINVLDNATATSAVPVPICNIKLNDTLIDGKVTAIIKIMTFGSTMYMLDGIAVSNSHRVFNKHTNKWILTEEHPDSLQIHEYNKPYLYCLNTTNKVITVGDTVFSDWDDIVEHANNADIHSKYEGGFAPYTIIKDINNDNKFIKDIQIGDILQNGEIVYGTVSIDGINVSAQYAYTFSNNTCVVGGPNLIFDSTHKLCKKKGIEKINTILYHLLTDVGTICIENVQFGDYNASIDYYFFNHQ